MENNMKTIYLDLNKQKRTLEQNEFTIDASSEEAKAFFTSKQPNQELVVDLENKTTYFEEYEMQEDGTRYSIYKADKENGVYVPDLEAIMAKDTKNLLQSIESSIQSMIDAEAKKLGYDNIVSACSYAGYDNEFQEEAIT